MAGTALQRKNSTPPNSDLAALKQEYNKLIDNVELIRLWAVALVAKLDADAGVTDTNYAAQATLQAIDTAAELTAAKITDVS